MGFTGFYWVLSSFIEFSSIFFRVFRILLGFVRFYQVLPIFIKFYRVLLGFVKFHRVLLGVTEFYRVFNRVLLSFTGFVLGLTVFFC